MSYSGAGLRLIVEGESASYRGFSGQLLLQRTLTQEDHPVRNRIDAVRPLPTPPPQGDTQPHADHLLMLIGEESDADEVLAFFREMWPEVEGTEEAPPHND